MMEMGIYLLYVPFRIIKHTAEIDAHNLILR